MITLSIAFVPLCEALAVGCFGLVKPFCSHGSSYNFGRGGSVCGHFHVAYLLSALFTLPFIPINGTLSAGFTKGAHLCCLSKFSRGLVEVFLIAPFHGGTVAQNKRKGKP